MGHTHFGNGCCEYKGTYKNNKFDSTLSATNAPGRASASKHPDFSGAGKNEASHSGEDVCVFTCVDGRQYKGGFKDGKKHGLVSRCNQCTYKFCRYILIALFLYLFIAGITYFHSCAGQGTESYVRKIERWGQLMSGELYRCYCNLTTKYLRFALIPRGMFASTLGSNRSQGTSTTG